MARARMRDSFGIGELKKFREAECDYMTPAMDVMREKGRVVRVKSKKTKSRRKPACLWYPGQDLNLHYLSERGPEPRASTSSATRA